MGLNGTLELLLECIIHPSCTYTTVFVHDDQVVSALY